jgi:hypothetical protein
MSRELTRDSLDTDQHQSPTAPVIAVGLFNSHNPDVSTHIQAVPLGTDHNDWADVEDRIAVALGSTSSEHGSVPEQAIGALSGADGIDVFTHGARFELSNTGFERVETTDPHPPADGDPLIVSTTSHPVHSLLSDTSSLATLGTGFDGWTPLHNHLTLASDTGHATRLIPRGAANRLHGADCVELCTLAAQFSVSQNTPNSPHTE